MSINQLQALNNMSVVVADTGDLDLINTFKPQDATTNPSLIYKASSMEAYKGLVNEAVVWGKKQNFSSSQFLLNTLDRISINFGVEILKIIPGRVSTEIDPRLSFDTQKTIVRCRKIVSEYEKRGIDRERVLMKIAATWEGIKAAEVLEKENIYCNLTLLFSLTQAAACAAANVFLISPFVGRILDWYKKNEGGIYDDPQDDPGVLAVKKIFYYYKIFNYDTVVMAASFRNIGEIYALAGCDRLTISPNFLQDLHDNDDPLEVQLSERNIPPQFVKNLTQLNLNELDFSKELYKDKMASEKLAEGIKAFIADIENIEKLILQF